MGQDEVTHRIIEEGSVWSLQESSQTPHARAAEGQGGAGQPPLLSGSFVGTQWHRGRSWLQDSSDGWDLGCVTEEQHGSVGRGEGVESMAAPSQGKDPSEHFYPLLIAANRFFCPHGLVLVMLT